MVTQIVYVIYVALTTTEVTCNEYLVFKLIHELYQPGWPIRFRLMLVFMQGVRISLKFMMGMIPCPPMTFVPLEGG